MLSRVLFPAPFGPNKVKTAPGFNRQVDAQQDPVAVVLFFDPGEHQGLARRLQRVTRRTARRGTA